MYGLELSLTFYGCVDHDLISSNKVYKVEQPRKQLIIHIMNGMSQVHGHIRSRNGRKVNAFKLFVWTKWRPKGTCTVVLRTWHRETQYDPPPASVLQPRRRDGSDLWNQPIKKSNRTSTHARLWNRHSALWHWIWRAHFPTDPARILAVIFGACSCCFYWLPARIYFSSSRPPPPLFPLLLLTPHQRVSTN